jgi:hypothetical protein
MKYNAKSIGIILCYILAIYGLIILIRKILNREEKNKSKTWSYYVEPYRYGFFTAKDDLGEYTYDDLSDFEPYRYGFGCKKCRECKTSGSKTCTDYYVKKAVSEGKPKDYYQDNIRTCMFNKSEINSICDCDEDTDIVCL